MLFQKSLCLEKSACMIYRKNLNRTSGHRVCSEHFVGGKRHDSNVFTIVPEAAKPTVIKERKSRNSFGLIEKNNHFSVDESTDVTIENESELSVRKHEIKCLKTIFHKENIEMQEQKLRADSEIAGLREQLTLTKFFLDRFKQNEPHFKFYTGLETYD